MRERSPTRTDRPHHRTWVLLLGLPLVAAAIGFVFAVALSYERGWGLVVFGLLAIPFNYTRLKAMSKASRDRT